MLSKTRTKYAYINYNDIPHRIQLGDLDAYDIIITKDTHEQYYINEDLVPFPILSKRFCYSSIEEALQSINNSSEIYEGQIISVLHDNKHKLYSIHINNNGYELSRLIDEFELNSLIEELDNSIVTKEDIDSLFGEEV